MGPFPSRVLSVFLVLIAGGCGGSTKTEISGSSGPTPTRCALTVAPPPAVPAAGGPVTLSVQTARDCAWAARSDAFWLTVDAAQAQGQGDGSFLVTAAENSRGIARSGDVAINEARATVAQDPAPCVYALPRHETDISHRGGRVSFDLQAVEACPWSARSRASWVRPITSGGTGSAQVELAVDSNAGGQRSAAIDIAGDLFIVTQERAPGGRSTCSYSVHPGSHNFPASGGDGVVRLATQAGCAWGAQTSESWITITSNANNDGAEDVHYRVAPNLSSSARRGTIAMGGGIHIVRQEAARSTN